MPDPRFLQHFTAAPLAGSGLLVPSDLGFAAWSDPPQSMVTSGAGPAAAGTLALRRFSIPSAMAITNVHLDVGTAGVALTAAQCFAGVWDQNGVMVGLTADASGVLAGAGLLTLPLVAGAGVPGSFGVDTPYIYVGVWFNGTTSPFYARQNPVDTGMVNGLASVNALQARAVTANTGLTTIATAPLQLANITKNASLNAPFWAAVS